MRIHRPDRICARCAESGYEWIEQRKQRRDLRECKPCKEKALAKMKAGADGDALVLSWGVPEVLNAAAEGLKGLGFRPEVIVRGETDWKSKAIRYVERRRPRWLFAWQRLYGPPGREVEAAAERHSARGVFMDFAVWPHYRTVIFDARGENAGAEIVGHLDALLADPVQARAIRDALPRVDAMARSLREAARKVAGAENDYGVDGVPDGFAFLPLQRRGDKVIELDAPPERREAAQLCRDLIAEAVRRDAFVVVKPHPQGGAPADIPPRGPHHRILQHLPAGETNGNLFAWCLEHMGHMVVVNSTTWTQAAALGKPVVAVGRGWFSRNHALTEAANIADAFAPKVHAPERARLMVALMLSRQLTREELAAPARLAAMLRLLYPGQTDPQAVRPERPLLIVGTGRSGTKWTAQALRLLGREVGHERIGPDGAVGWNFVARRPYGDADCRRDARWKTVLHQVRHPLDAIGSLTTHVDALWRFVYHEMDLPWQSDPLRRAARYWVNWNRRAQALAEWTYRVEELRDGTETWAEFKRRAGLPEGARCPEVPRDLNRRRHREVSLEDVRALGGLGKTVLTLARSYGYDV